MADDDKAWKSAELAGKKILVVYFYPADMTGGCTKQACLYRDAMEDFQNKDVEIIGISGDSAENHRHFKEAHHLNFTLLADTEGKIAKAFGVKTGPGFTNTATIGEREINFARDIMTSRWTFVIDKDWNIAYKNTSVNPTADSEEVLKVVEKINAEK
jgi:peroxiredoxin Q/BCP